ncbi:unnamed protein product [Vitrella brassicaformis CCMP3155]|uniref:NodB homology domain-containing protein n=1 Tax=Vitrella brassicaformis (strain CCMP3155) TaxID=1169540 RepID=A0A0G4H6H2_VITBC|nr:unnamed protein product [Vitrella brassicaformis CCMP3155]|eukprot:CEM39214.1 unnamed protein product [Vitrella brassicaformis CCMP3155]
MVANDLQDCDVGGRFPRMSSKASGGALPSLLPSRSHITKWAWRSLHTWGSRWALAASAYLPFLPQSKCVFYFDIQKPVIALTIDDAPGSDESVSFQLLDCLKDNGVKATFFIISSHVDGQESVVRRMVEDGHELANHMTHDKPAHRLDEATFERLLLQCESVLNQFVPDFKERQLKWYRPPMGLASEVMHRVLAKHRYTSALGDVYPLDVNLQEHPTFLRDFVHDHAKPGSIVILHFPSATFRAENLWVLKQVVPQLTAKFECVTLSELHDIAKAEGDNGSNKPPTKREKETVRSSSLPEAIASDPSLLHSAQSAIDVDAAAAQPPAARRALSPFLSFQSMSRLGVNHNRKAKNSTSSRSPSPQLASLEGDRGGVGAVGCWPLARSGSLRGREAGK